MIGLRLMFLAAQSCLMHCLCEEINYVVLHYLNFILVKTVSCS